MGGSTGWVRALATLAVVAGIDQAAKAVATASLSPGETARLVPGLELTLVRNPGVAFGALAGAGGVAIAAVTAAALVALVAYFVRNADEPLLWLPVGLVLGGAAGNVVDRVRTGAVLDFIDPALWPAFNLADTAIVLGILGVLYLAEVGGAARRERAAG